MGVEMSDVFVMLRPPSEWRHGSKRELIEAMEAVLDERVSGTAFGFSQPIELATLDIEPSAAQISRERIQRRITTDRNVRGRDIASVVGDARSAIEPNASMPPGYTIEWDGQFENLERASQRLAIVVPLALLLIFALGGLMTATLLTLFVVPILYPWFSRSRSERAS